MNPWKQLISDDTGAPSTMRVLALVIVVPVMIVWTTLCIRQNTFIVPPSGIISLLVTGIGGKALQSFAENLAPIRPLQQQPQPQINADEHK